MGRPFVFVTRPVFDEALDLIRAAADVEVWPQPEPPPYEALRERAARCDGLFSLLTDRIDAPLLGASPNLRVVSNMAVGYNNIDIPAATRRGIYVGNTPGVLTETTADLAFALLLALARRVSESERFVHRGEWKTWGPMDFLGADVHGAALGIVGMGRIGAAVARRAAGFGMRVRYTSRTPKPDAPGEPADLDTLLRESDFVSLHVPLSEETRHMIGGRELGLMKPTAYLINTSRGEVVDPKALYEAAKSGSIAGAALDVTEPEPIPAGDPLLRLDNVLITPHVGSASRATRLKMAEMAARNIIAVLEGGTPPHCVNPEAGPQR